jgi:putative DNA primase/helicase
MSDIPDDKAKHQEEIKTWAKKHCDPEAGAATEKHIQEMLETAGKVGIEKYVDENEEFNPILLAKAIMRDHEFIYDETSHKLYVYSQNEKRFTDHAEDLIRREIALRLDESTRSRIYPDVEFYITATAKTRSLDEHPELVIVENGILDVVHGQLMPFSSEFFLTAKLHVTYDDKAECPKILKFLSEILDADQIILLQEAVGYALYRVMTHHKAFLLLGSGANGKSTLLELIHKFLGYDNCSALTIQDINYGRFATANLYNKLANICSDLPASKLEQTGTWKRSVGGDTINAEVKNKMPFPFISYAKQFYAANTLPPISSSEDNLAFFRRWIIFEFKNLFLGRKADKNKLHEITTDRELSGFLNFALVGLAQLLANGDFSQTENLDTVRQQYLRRSDSVKAFIEEKLEVTDNHIDFIEAQNLFDTFIEYCKHEGIPTKPQQLFTKGMKEFCSGARFTRRSEGPRGHRKYFHVYQYLKLKKSQQTLLPTVQDPETCTAFAIPSDRVLRVPCVQTFSYSTCNVKTKSNGEIGNSCTPSTQGTPNQAEENLIASHCAKWRTGHVHSLNPTA